MVNRPEVLALIPARGGSKSIPRKNLRRLAGLPLVAHPIRTALATELVTRVIVTTDDAEIAEVARRHGAEVPFMRPAELGGDSVTDLPVFQHALRWLDEREGYRPEIVVHLRATSPLATAAHVDKAVGLLLREPRADSVRTVAVPLQNPFKMWRIGDDGFMTPLLDAGCPEPYNQPRQALPPVYWQTGYVDATRRRTILELGSMTGKRILPLVLEQADSIDIDSELTLEHAEAVLKRKSPTTSLRQPVKLLALDFDGVLTDNRVHVSEDGREAVVCNRSDGDALRRLMAAGVHAVVLSSEANPVVAARCRKLGVACKHGLGDKTAALREAVDRAGCGLEEVAYVGNDVNDIPCMDLVGTPVAVADAAPEVLAKAAVVLRSAGGLGAVREICELIMASNPKRVQGGV